VLGGVRVQLESDQLTLTGTDLDLTISVQLAVAGSDDGVVVVPSRLASEIVRALGDGAVEVESAEDELRITHERSEFSLRTIPSEEFPQFALPSGDAVTIDAAALTGALDQVVRAASTDDSRPILTGVLLAAEGDGLRLVATDSYRLALRDLAGVSVLGDEQSVLVPGRALGELVRMSSGSDKVTLRLGERDASFEAGDESRRVSLITRLIEGDFPNYRGLIPTDQPNKLVVAREPLLEAVRRVKLLARDTTPVRLVMKDGSLELFAVTQDVGEAHEALDATYDGEELTVAFNADYLIDGIEVTPGDEVELETVDALKPAVLRSTDDREFLYLLMPVRVP
jgi:DNA polymerase-3 subunit beta